MNGRKKLLIAIAAVYAVPFIALLTVTLALLIFFGFTNANNAEKVEQNYDQINVVRPGITRKEIIDIALTLNGKIGYFWGGHSNPGWNSDWGKPKLVTSPGDWTYGTTQPYGLDCSGYIEWVFRSAGTNELNGTTVDQLKKTYPINESQLKEGDLCFANTGNGSGNHVGIFLKRENGKKFYIHCEGGTGVTINSTPVFQYWRRPYIQFDGE